MKTALPFASALLIATVSAGLGHLLFPFLGHDAPHIFLFPGLMFVTLRFGTIPAIATAAAGLAATQLWDPATGFPILRDTVFSAAALGLSWFIRRDKQLKHAAQKKAEELRASEERFRTFADFTYNWEYWLAPDRRLIYTSPSCERITGYAAAQFMADNPLLDKIVFREDQAGWEAHRMESCRKYQVLDHEFRIITRDGRIRWIAHTCQPVRSPEGEFRGWRVSNRDVTEQKLAEAELREADRRKDEYLGMLAHELRNPLAPIRNAAYMLRSLPFQDSQLERFRTIIERQVAHMARLLDDLLDVARITRGKISLQPGPVAIREVIARAVEAAQPLIAARRQHLHTDLPGPELRVRGDFDRLVQVVGNLLTNAAKYTERQGKIWLAAAAEKDQVVIRVRDNGIGIAPAMRERIFELFTQASEDKSFGGLGIGLTLARRLVEMHGGSLEASSPGLGLGSEFVVRLPVLRADHREGGEAAGNRPGPKRQRVLVVDDMADAADSLAELIRLWDHGVEVAQNGALALEKCRAFNPEIVLLDIGLPDLDGYRVAERLRHELNFRGKIIALTGFGQKEDQARAARSGMDQLLVKPVDPECLQELLAGGRKRCSSEPAVG